MISEFFSWLGFYRPETFAEQMELISMLFAIVGGIYALIKWNQQIKLKRAEYVNTLLEQMRNDDDMAYALKIIDYEDNEVSNNKETKERVKHKSKNGEKKASSQEMKIDEKKWGEPWYDKNFHGGELESKMDKLMAYFSYICYLRKCHIFRRREFQLFKYDIDEVLESKQVWAFFYNMYHCCLVYGLPFPYKDLLEYGVRKMPLDFEKRDYKKYTDHLKVEIILDNKKKEWMGKKKQEYKIKKTHIKNAKFWNIMNRKFLYQDIRMR